MRKKLIGIALCMVLFLGLVACGNSEKVAEDAPGLGAVEYVYDVTWEELEYTAGLPAPTGTINCAMLNEAGQWCGVFMEDVSEAEYNEYMDSLQEQGFQMVTSKSGEVKGQNFVAVGTVLSNGTGGLSVSYADGVLGIYISWGEV